MRDSRPLEFLLWRAAIVLGVSLVFFGGGEGECSCDAESPMYTPDT